LAVSGILESVDVTKAKPIEVEVLRVFREKHTDILKTIRDEQKFSKELQDKARAIIQPIVNQITGVAA
jgi:F0F1-type ATP synthase alpha subunit